MKTLYSFIIALFFVLPVTMAHVNEELSITDAEGNVISTAHIEENGEVVITSEVDKFTTDLVKASLHANKEEKPGIVVKLVNNEIVNLQIISDENPISLGMKTNSDADIIELRAGNYNVPTLNVYVKESVITAAENADGLDFVLTALENGDIRLEGVGFGNKLKLFFAKLGLKVANWFV
jgi:hypothetical protein